MISISLAMRCFELRSLFQNKTAKPVLRSTKDATLALPCSRRKILKSPSQSPNFSRVLMCSGLLWIERSSGSILPRGLWA
ncbi:hypothetical protein PH5382_03853 [Phaeobacter sp. CECT 5382]|nr:hypothetical protein PH5382_03853 [Phaeobacter sp. CECT 5382]